MNEAMQREVSEETIAVKLANYVLDKETDPDADICVLARQFLRKREALMSVVQAMGGHVFVPSKEISAAYGGELRVCRNDADNGYDIYVLQREALGETPVE